MRKCKGCGIQLQDREKGLPGYVVDLEQDYCQRCFRLSHYGDMTHFKSNHVSNEKIYEIYSRYRNSLFVIIIDVLDALVLKDDDLLDVFRDYRTLLIINKTDLLPENVNEKKIDNMFSKMVFDLNKKYRNIKAALLSNKFESKFNEQFFNIIDDLGETSIVFAGRANAGKSSLINKLLHNNDLTTSMYPGTTLDEVSISYKNYRFIDTPGLVDVNSYATYLNSEKYKLSKIDKMIRPQTFQLSEPQSYFYDGLLRVDIIPSDKASISFYINNNNKIHRTRYDNGDDYYQKHYCEFILRVKPLGVTDYSIRKSKLFVIKGLGMFKINGECFVNIHSLADVKLYESEVDI
ncbi:MAG: 50S ribosome-binding GTPase [Erysipelotrichaceae bacterium]|nr:50S ribosome-binding GTPase [Erysipelotrichaceae bacterium]